MKTPEEILSKNTGLTINDDMVCMQTEIIYIIESMEEYGKQMYNQAIEDAAENAIYDYDGMELTNKESIIKLKK